MLRNLCCYGRVQLEMVNASRFYHLQEFPSEEEAEEGDIAP
jgi:hypothetical protein